MGILAFILSIGLGFGLACLIFASILAKSNDIGNNMAEASRYTPGIDYDRSRDKLNKSERDSFTTGYIHAEDIDPNEPLGEKPVEQSLK